MEGQRDLCAKKKTTTKEERREVKIGAEVSRCGLEKMEKVLAFVSSRMFPIFDRRETGENYGRFFLF